MAFFPVQNQQRYRPDSECSDVEYVTHYGNSACPQEYEGRACDAFDVLPVQALAQT